MKLNEISAEGCYAGDLPDYWGDSDGMIWPERRSRRARIFRAEAKAHFRWSAALILFLLVMLVVQRYFWEEVRAERDEARGQLKARQRPAVLVQCTQHGEIPASDTLVYESCIATVYRF